jgi:hypothetical protein
MPHLANNACPCAAVIYCSQTNQYGHVTWVEKSTKKAANNYCAKILGGVQYTVDNQGGDHWAQRTRSWHAYCGV